MATSFDQHWRNFKQSDFTSPKMQVADAFLRPVFELLSENAQLLDVGCGDGIHAEITRRKRPDLSYTGVDIAAVVDDLGKIFDPSKFRFFRQDALNLEFPDRTFDAVISFGVLGYTADPRKAFAEISRVVKKDGIVTIWLFENPGFPLNAIHRLISTFLRCIPGKLAFILCGFLAPILWIVPNKSGVTLSTASWKECAEIIAVNFLYPVFFFNEQQIHQWCEKEQWAEWRFERDAPVTVSGRR